METLASAALEINSNIVSWVVKTKKKTLAFKLELAHVKDKCSKIEILLLGKEIILSELEIEND